MKFNVPDMSCGHCTAAIDKALRSADPDADVTTDLNDKTVSVTSSKDAQALMAVLKDAGYPATPA